MRFKIVYFFRKLYIKILILIYLNFSQINENNNINNVIRWKLNLIRSPFVVFIIIIILNNAIL